MSDTEYNAVIIDNTDVFSAAEEAALLNEMSPLCEHGNVCITTLVSYEGLTYEIMNDLYTDTFGDTSGIILFIETKQSAMKIYCHGELSHEINSSSVYDITDKIAGYATGGDYYACADNFIAETQFFFFDRELSAPMKLVTSALMSLIIGLTATYFIVKAFYGRKKTTRQETLDAMFTQQEVNDTDLEPVDISKIVSIPKYITKFTNKYDDY